MKLKMIARVCPVCASTVDSKVFAEANVNLTQLDEFAFASRKFPEYMHWRLIECPECDLLYANPAPAAQSLGAAYDEAAFDSAPEARCAALSYARFLPRITRRLPNLEGALDIGTGDGAFLKRLIQAGFSGVVGVEPSRAPIAAAAPEIQPLIRHDIFKGEDFGAENFSLVTCFQTFEHLSDPLAMCAAAYRLLRPGGAVLFVGHNRRAVSARLLGSRSPIFDIEHLQLFSLASVTRLLVEAGFVHVEVGSLFNRYPIDYWIKLLPLPVVLKRRLIRIMQTAGIGRVPVPLPAGNLYAIGYKMPQ